MLFVGAEPLVHRGKSQRFPKFPHWGTVQGHHHSTACSSTFVELCNNTNPTISQATPVEVHGFAREWWLFPDTILALFSIAFALDCCQKQSKKAKFWFKPNSLFFLLILMGYFSTKWDAPNQQALPLSRQQLLHFFNSLYCTLPPQIKDKFLKLCFYCSWCLCLKLLIWTVLKEQCRK